MEFGSQEWFDALNKRVTFPALFVFYVDPDGNVFSSVLDSKARYTGNIQYKTLTSYRSNDAIASVVRCNSDSAYYHECKRLRDIWS